MNYLIAFVPAAVVGGVAFFGWSVCRVASDADDAIAEGFEDHPPRCSPFVEPVTIIGDLLAIEENQLLAKADDSYDAGELVSAAVLLEQARDVNIARRVVADLIPGGY